MSSFSALRPMRLFGTIQHSSSRILSCLDDAVDAGATSQAVCRGLPPRDVNPIICTMYTVIDITTGPGNSPHHNASHSAGGN